MMTAGTLLCYITPPVLTGFLQILFSGFPKSFLDMLAPCTVSSLGLFLETSLSTWLWSDLVLKHVSFP